MLAQLHLAEETFALHLLLQRPEGLVDIVVTDENLHVAFLFNPTVDRPNSKRRLTTGARCFCPDPEQCIRMSLYSIRSFRGTEKAEPKTTRQADQIAFYQLRA